MPRKASLTTAMAHATTKKRMLKAPDVNPGRASQSPIAGWFNLDVKDQLRLMGVEQRKTIQQMLGEALNDYFAKHGKPELATVNGRD